MKAIVLNENNDTFQKMALFPPEAEGENGRRCAMGVRFTPAHSIAYTPNRERIDDQNGHPLWEIDWGACKLEIHPRLYGRCVTWDELLVALYWGEGDTFGEQLERFGREAHRAREYPWRVQKERFSGYTEYRIRESQYEIDREFGLAGRIVSQVRITPYDKVNEGMPLELSLADWYVFLKTIPSRPWAELEEAYRDTPPKEMFPIKAEWHAPGAEPWDSGIRTYTTDEGIVMKEVSLAAFEQIKDKLKANPCEVYTARTEDGQRMYATKDADMFKSVMLSTLRQKEKEE